MIVLGIETSCDETAAAVCRDGRILSSLVNTQTIHHRYGGVVPELASREHERGLNILVDAALVEAGLKRDTIQALAVTQGPGLAGSLLAGICFAKGLALGLGVPIIAVNHLEAHIFANFLADPTLDHPFVCLLVSGGHTQLWWVPKRGVYELLGQSRDDAAGEAFDKGARILGLGYPGGPEIERLAELGRVLIDFPRSLLERDSLDFSFSGLKTALLYFMDSYQEATSPYSLADVAASYQQAILEVLAEKLARALEHTASGKAVIAGGVAANRHLRELVSNRLPSTRTIYPDLPLCTDNAAMVAFLGEVYLQEGQTSSLDFSARPNLRLG